jgi:hypothetical protein
MFRPVAKQTIVYFIQKTSRLYEQGRSTVSAATVLEMYVRRWASIAAPVRFELFIIRTMSKKPVQGFAPGSASGAGSGPKT